MQNVINSVKGTALGVAEYLTPVLKVLIIFLNNRYNRSTNLGYLKCMDKNNKTMILSFYNFQKYKSIVNYCSILRKIVGLFHDLCILFFYLSTCLRL